jgi:hypothetical protein
MRPVFAASTTGRRPPAKRTLTVGVLAIALACSVLPATASPVDVDIELVLAADASGSMDVDEQRLQREGYPPPSVSPRLFAQSPAVPTAVLRSHTPSGETLASTSSSYHGQSFSTPSDASDFADRIAAPRPMIRPGGISISSALLFAAVASRAGARSFRQIVDLSGESRLGGAPRRRSRNCMSVALLDWARW